MGTDIYLIEKTRVLPRLPAEVRKFVYIEDNEVYSLNEIREMIKEFEDKGVEDPDGHLKRAAHGFLEASVALWSELGWDDEEIGANFLVSC